MSAGIAHAYVTAVVGRPARRSPKLPPVPRETDPGRVLLDGTLAECGRAGDNRAGFSRKYRRHGVNVQGVAIPRASRRGPHPHRPDAPTA